MATQRITEPEVAVRPIAFTVCAIGLLIFCIGMAAAVVLARVPQPGYVFLLPGVIATAGLFYVARGIIYLFKH